MAATQQSNVEIVEQLYDAFNQGDLETVMAGFADDITWTEPEGSPLGGGTYHGRDAVMQNAFAPLDELYETFEASVDRFIDGGDTIVAEGTQRGTMSDGTVHEIPAAHIMDLKNGKVQQFTSYEDTALGQQLLEQ